nr:flagellar filament capping protein FliD [Cohnella sp. WQ 127256]
MAVAASGAQDGSALNSYKVKVNSIAQSQKNSGLDLNNHALTSIQSGANEFKLTIGDKSTTIKSNIAKTDTNEQALTKLKDAINDSRTGVSAKIVTDSKLGTSKLELTSDKTGTKQAFEITDEVGNAAAVTGINRVTSAAADASYTVNDGKAQSSQSNEIELEKGKVAVTLLKPTTETIDIKVRQDEKKAVQQVKEMITSYNSMIDRLNDAGGFLNPAVKRSLEQVVRSSSYEQLGISKNGDGTLKLDEAKLSKSLSTNFEQTSKAISGSNSLAKSLEKASGRFDEVPVSSLLNQKMQAMQQFTTYQSSMQYQSPFPISGVLLNSVY